MKHTMRNNITESIMWLIVVIGLLLTLTNCGPKSSSPSSCVLKPVSLVNTATCNPTGFTFCNDVFVYSGSTFNGHRLYFIHGSPTGDHITGLMSNPVYYQIVTQLMAKGWQIVEFDLPYYDAHRWDDGGVQYREAYRQKLEQTFTYTESTYGHSTFNAIGGVSYGGLHAMMGMAVTTHFDVYFGIVPMTKVGAYNLWQGIDAPQFDPYNEVAKLQKPGYLVWNTTDNVVDYRLTASLYSIISTTNTNMNSTVYNTGGHDVPPCQNLDYITNWLLKF